VCFSRIFYASAKLTNNKIEKSKKLVLSRNLNLDHDPEWDPAFQSVRIPDPDQASKNYVDPY
jgi:hypothetical protein